MVNLNDSSINNAKVYITNDVNATNFDKIHLAYKNCSLYIDRKFGNPINTDINIGKSQFSHKIVSDASNIFDTMAMNDTQKKSAITKIKFWCIDTFSDIIAKMDDNKTNLSVFIDNNISKHEWIMIGLLFKYGVSFTIISETTMYADSTFDNKEVKELFNTDESLNYKKESGEIKKITELRHLDEIENAIYSNEELISVIINGVEDLEATCNFYGKLNVNCRLSNSFRLFEQTLGPVLYEESSKIPRIKLIDTNYLMVTVPMFFNCAGHDKAELSKALQFNFEKLVGTMNLQQLYNKMMFTVCKVNELLADKNMTHIVFYGAPSLLDAIILDTINSIHKYNIIILNSDKSIPIETNSFAVLELNNSAKFFSMPKTDKRNVIKTAAASAERVINDELFNGQTLGLYRPGQFTVFQCNRFTTTFDEIKIWWKKDVYMRPGFSGDNNIAIIPTMFKIVCGVCENMDDGKSDTNLQYIHYISRLITDKTFLFRTANSFNSTVMGAVNNPNGHKIVSLRDINRTTIENQKPFYENGLINRPRITSSINYKYGFLSVDKQEAIFSNIEKLINDNYINYESYNVSYQQYIDVVLNTLLNLHIDITRVIQWFMYYNESPKVILVMESEIGLVLQSVILLCFLSMMGFDIILFVPTCYNTIESRVNETFIYDKHIIGESRNNIRTETIKQLPDLPQVETTQDKINKPKKKGLFGGLFG